MMRESDMVLENILKQLESVLEDYEVCFDEVESRYFVKNCNNFYLTPEQFSWIYTIGLQVFSIERTDEFVKITLIYHKGFIY